MEKHLESKYFFTKFGHFYFLFLLYIYIYIYIFSCRSVDETNENIHASCNTYTNLENIKLYFFI